MAARTPFHAASATGWSRLQPQTPTSRPAASSRPRQSPHARRPHSSRVPEPEVCGAGVLTGRRQPGARLVRPVGRARPAAARARPAGAGRPRAPLAAAAARRRPGGGRGGAGAGGRGRGGNGGRHLFLLKLSAGAAGRTGAQYVGGSDVI